MKKPLYFRDEETEAQRGHPDPISTYLTQTRTDPTSLAIDWFHNSILPHTPIQQTYTKPLLYANPLWGAGCAGMKQKA